MPPLHRERSDQWLARWLTHRRLQVGAGHDPTVGWPRRSPPRRVRGRPSLERRRTERCQSSPGRAAAPVPTPGSPPPGPLTLPARRLRGAPPSLVCPRPVGSASREGRSDRGPGTARPSSARRHPRACWGRVGVRPSPDVGRRPLGSRRWTVGPAGGPVPARPVRDRLELLDQRQAFGRRQILILEPDSHSSGGVCIDHKPVVLPCDPLRPQDLLTATAIRHRQLGSTRRQRRPRRMS